MSDVSQISSDFTKAFEKFNDLLVSPANRRSKLWSSWHFLQVYSTWGLRLPNTEKKLVQTLKIPNTLGFKYFNDMLQSYQSIHNASKFFKNEVFDQVVNLGIELENFAKKASTKEDDIFSDIIELLEEGDEESMEAALSLIIDLREASKNNAEKARQVNANLDEYSNQLTKAKAELATTQDKLDSDKETSQERIDKIGGETSGEMKKIMDEMKERQDEYEEAVKVAATTPTYVWIFPWGTAAAISMAAIYGAKATRKLKAYHKLEKEAEALSGELATLIASRNAQMLAQEGISSAQRYTSLAILHTQVIKEAWDGLTQNLEEVEKYISAMVTITDEEVRLESTTRIRIYADDATKAWTELLPVIQTLTDKPYIKVKEEDMDLESFIAELEMDFGKMSDN